MADVSIAVASLFERTEHQVAKNPLLGFALDLGHQLLIVARRQIGVVERDCLASETLHRNRAACERISEVGRDLFEFEHALGIRAFVNAEDHRHAGGFQMGRDGFVCGQHELLNQAVRDVAGRASDAGHLAKLVEFKQSFGQVEIDRTTANALAVQDQRQLAHQLKPWDQPRVAFS